VAGPQGELIYEASVNEEVKVIDISMERTETVRRMWPFFRDRRIDYFEDLTKRFRD
jgi:N-carbamoylputrescine amidase